MQKGLPKMERYEKKSSTFFDVSWAIQNLTEAQLRGANLSGADLTEAKLVLTWLDHANLNWTCLRRTDFKCADLSNATLIGANISEANFTDTILPEKTKRYFCLTSNHQELNQEFESFIDAKIDSQATTLRVTVI